MTVEHYFGKTLLQGCRSLFQTIRKWDAASCVQAVSSISWFPAKGFPNIETKCDAHSLFHNPSHACGSRRRTSYSFPLFYGGHDMNRIMLQTFRQPIQVWWWRNDSAACQQMFERAPRKTMTIASGAKTSRTDVNAAFVENPVLLNRRTRLPHLSSAMVVFIATVQSTVNEKPRYRELRAHLEQDISCLQ